MLMKFFVYCPDNKSVINAIIKTASSHGAGTYGNYTQVAFITHGEGNWKTEKGARPIEGKVGSVTRSNVAKIEMTCDTRLTKKIVTAIKAIHPWEQVDIEFVTIKKN